ncbi:MAG: ATP-binding protein [Gilvibacter sp.]
MKRIFKHLLFCLFPIATVFAQEPWQPYIEQYETSASTHARLTALDSILSLTFHADPSLFIPYSKKYIDLALGVERYEDAAKKAMNLSFPINNINKPEVGISYIDKVLQHQEKIQDSFLVAGLYLKRGGSYSRLDYEKALEDYTTAIDNFSLNDSIYKADAYLFRGQVYVNLGNFVAAIDDYNTASNYFDQLKDYEYMLYAKQGGITIFSMNGFYDQAKQQREELIESLKQRDLNHFLSTEYYNQAVDDRKMNFHQKAYEALIEAQKYLDPEKGSNQIFFAIHSLLTSYYVENGNMAKAKEHLDIIEERRAGIDSDLIVESHYNSAKSSYLYYSGKATEALPFAISKLENAQTLGFEEEQSHALLDLSQIYQALGDTETSLSYYKSFVGKKDSLYNRSKTNALLYYQTLYETEKQEHEIESQNANIALLEKDNENFKKMVIFLGVSMILLLGVIYLIKDRKNLKTKQELQERFSQELLTQQETERKRISKELHDGLGQQLLLIKNNLVLSENTTGKEMMDTAIDEVRSISRALHPFQLQELGLTKAIEHMIAQIDENSSLFITSEVDNIDHLFDKENEVNIYRIIQESFNNIIKHSGAEASKISIKKQASSVFISIRDNGKGFIFSEKYKDLKSLGLKTLKERTRFLKGIMKVDSSEKNGTVIEFNVPYV